LPGDPPPVKSDSELAQYILDLTDPSAEKRAEAANAIFRHGRELARLAIERWLANKPLADTFVVDQSGFPETTVGIALFPDAFDNVLQACGSPPLADVPPDQDAREFELDFHGGVRLDVLTTRDRSGVGAIARHLRKFGESIQQVELLVRNVDRATEILASEFSVSPVYPKTRPGANGTRINFFLVTAPSGKKVLIELVEAVSPA
jgi:hypothetical protein